MRGPTGRLLALPGPRRLVLLCAFLGVLTWALLVVQWALVAVVVSRVATGQAAPAALSAQLAGALTAWLARACVAGLRDRTAARASAGVRRGLRADLLRKLTALGPAHAAGERAGELATTVTEGVGKLDGVVGRLLPGAATAAVVPPLVAGTVLVLDPASGGLLLLTGPLVLVFLWLTGTLASRAARGSWETLAQLGAVLVDTLRVLPTLVLYGRARSSARWLTEVSEAHRVSTMRLLRTAFLSGFVLEFGAVLCTALVAVTVGVRLFQGQLELERALLVLLFTPEFFAPLRALGADRHASLEGGPAAERVFALLDAPGPARGCHAVPPGVPSLELRGVTVRYGDRVALRDVDLDLPPLSRTALVGPSGAGKTTAVRLLLGFAVPDAGTVLVDGVPLTDLDPDAWRARVAYVPERPWLLPGTVADNVRLGRPAATDAEVERALARAGALDLVRRLPQGTATPLGEDGARLSGGERLRLALARAFVQDAALLVLDEPTGQLDAATEREVLVALADLAAGRTVVTVTHRPAPLALHDRVVALEEGRLRTAVVPR
ncbi:ATP-binding cassette subfamily C protein CydD/ATP-binding cassette subfamily C protein CydCD [Geodermatophilus normandii]|uniref:ATP-binding cassette subfamily C protein CydD/ATP-binding cassette subfamily C protein CydCD n=1 Tax=Geodermatophilus normandii TaxID=1137989 RepID=A0A317QN15_9ACTN|nr:thiol reductant ABC exporter subunit CydD [Geodermatophilus normandii]PWW24429.1 ATP-binding cassette subfamily C protein CydD/ATP-binding cassette subfamily C protein CydCD [Geodermatophilus normandii]